MKMKVGRLNISLSVEDTILTERTREESTCYLLNYLSMIFSEAAKLEKYNPDRTPEKRCSPVGDLRAVRERDLPAPEEERLLR